MNTRPIIRVGIAAVTLSLAAGAADFETRLDETVRSLPEPFQGVLLVAQGDKVLFARGYGLAERSSRIENRPETRFLIGSITKQFTAVLTLRLAQLGLLKLDAPVVNYIPEYPQPNGEKITVRHLLAHRSGIPHHWQGIPRYFDVVDRLFYTPREYLALFWNRPLLHEPGSAFAYSSPGYTLLGIVLENATGLSYAELLREHVLEPLGMERTTVENNLTVQPDTAVGYRQGLTGLVLARREEESTRGAAGSILTTVEDLARFQRVFSRSADAVLDEDSKTVLLAKHSPNYAFAGALLSVPNTAGDNTLTIVSHSGSSYGFAARADHLVELDASIIALSNLQEADLGQLFNRAGDVVLEELGFRSRRAASQGKAQQTGHSSPAAPKPPAVDAKPAGDDRLAQYAGMYYSVELQTTYRFEWRSGELVARRFLGPDDLRMTFLGENKLECSAGTLNVERDSEGAIRGFSLKRGSATSYFVRR